MWSRKELCCFEKRIGRSEMEGLGIVYRKPVVNKWFLDVFLK
jgi:hypothetical protein